MAKYDAMFDPRKHYRPGTYAKRVVVFKRDGELIVRKYVKPKDPRTADQLAARQKIGEKAKKLSAAWRGLSPGERDRCRRIAQRRGLPTGFMAFTQIWWEKGGSMRSIRAWGSKVGRQMTLKIKK